MSDNTCFRAITFLLLALIVTAFNGCSTSHPISPGVNGEPVKVISPSGQVRIELTVRPTSAAEHGVYWRVFLKDKPIILESRLGVDLGNGSLLGNTSVVDSVRTRSWDLQYAVPVGKRSRITDRGSEAVVSLHEESGSNRTWELVMRAYDDGVAFRYHFPKQPGMTNLSLASEHSDFTFPNDSKATLLPLANYTTSFEARYQQNPIGEIPNDKLVGLPLLVECPGVGAAAITEANLTDYAGMYLAHDAAQPNRLESRLSPLPGNPKLAVQSTLPHDSPWRVVMLGDTAGSLIASDLIFDLNVPSKIADASWIHPGKTTFPWWNDYYLENVSFKPGQNTATHKHYIDFCAEAGIPYHSLDGYQGIGWYGCEIRENHPPADITKAIPEIDLPELLSYAKTKGVKLRVWLHWEDVKGQMDKAFPLYHQWGIEGVMLDFMNRDDQEMENFLREVLEKAAENHLTVTLHGMSKPTGLERTYPNLLNSESVLNDEYDKWDKLGCPPAHQLMAIYTRMLAGPMDFHQGSLRGVPVDQFKPRNTAPLVMGTPTFMLATYVVFENHLPMVADYPSAYRGNPALPMLAQIPATWDDTKFISGEVPYNVVIARRKGDEWYIGAMNAGAARTIDVPLSFLGSRNYQAQVFGDDPDGKSPYHLTQRTEQAMANRTMRLQLQSGGGAVVWFSPVK